MPRNRAFTLVELLVVVSIIVLLLAMLAPAMSRAIYRAQLAKCAANMKTTAVGVQSYAFDFKKYYPDRQLPAKVQDKTIPPVMLSAPDDAAGTFVGIDIRPELKGYVQINKQLNDPFVEPLDLEYEPPVREDTVNCSYTLWFGWHFTTASERFLGMDRLGDTWEYRGRNYGLLLGDLDLIWNYPRNISASHPDVGSSPKLWQQVVKSVFEPTYRSNARQVYWVRFGGPRRALIDVNHAYEDGSVQMLTNVEEEDDRYDYVAYFYDLKNEGSFRTYVPKR